MKNVLWARFMLRVHKKGILATRSRGYKTFGLNIFISFYNYTSIQIYMMIIQAMGLERELKAYKVLLPIKLFHAQLS